MTLSRILIYEGNWNKQNYIVALDAESAKHKIENHFAFGNPEEHEYAVGNQWAIPGDNSGWKITKRTVETMWIDGRIAGNPEEDETAHIIWECPDCHQSFSEECIPSDKSPLLCTCSCGNKNKYFLVEFNEKPL